MNNTLYIFGAGAIGKTFSVLYKHHNRNVVLVNTSKDNFKPFEQKITLNFNERKITKKILTISISDIKSIDGLIIVTAKSFANHLIAEKIKDFPLNTPIVLMQNGLGIEDVFVNRGFVNIYRGIIYSAAYLVGNNNIKLLTVLNSFIGQITDKDNYLLEIQKSINTEEFPFEIKENILKKIWQKAIINCTFNSICPLLNTDNGIYERNDKVKILFEEIVEECVNLANEFNIVLSMKKILKIISRISVLTDGELVTTQYDLVRNKETEIRQLNLKIANLAQSINKLNLVKKTKLIGELVLIKSSIK